MRNKKRIKIYSTNDLLLLPNLNPTDDFLGVYPRELPSLSLNESGVDADNDDLDGRDIAIDFTERSRT